MNALSTHFTMCKAFSMKNRARICYKQNGCDAIKNCVSKVPRKCNCHERNEHEQEKKAHKKSHHILHEKIMSAPCKIIYCHFCLWKKKQTMAVRILGGCDTKWILSKMKNVFFFRLLTSLFTESRLTATEIKRTKTWLINNSKQWIIFK